ncbi:MAG: hypothetical protein ACP5T0_03805 [Verrucomicrobiia bacterium]
MALLSKKEVLNLKLKAIKSQLLISLVDLLKIPKANTATELIKNIVEINPDSHVIDDFIKRKYKEKIDERRKLISDEELIKELHKIEKFSWGIVQGQLDQKIQMEYVRKYYRYDDLIKNIKSTLHDDVTNYVMCTWFNHWTTVLIEEHIGLHPKVIPTVKNIKGVDIFFGDQPFDLKITYLPRGYSCDINNKKDLAIWMYENQGAQRFGSDNRLFVVLIDENNPNDSWKLKMDFDLVFKEIDDFFNNESVSGQDEIIFRYGRNTYTALAKVLLIKKNSKHNNVLRIS